MDEKNERNNLFPSIVQEFLKKELESNKFSSFLLHKKLILNILWIYLQIRNFRFLEIRFIENPWPTKNLWLLVYHFLNKFYFIRLYFIVFIIFGDWTSDFLTFWRFAATAMNKVATSIISTSRHIKLIY